MSSFFSSPSESVNPPTMNTYNPQSMGGADTAAFGGIGNLGQYNTFAQLYPQVFNTGQAMINNPFGVPLMQGAQTAGAMGQQGAVNQFNQGGNLYGMSGQVQQTGFDPQSALYARTAQQTQDQTRAALAARGVDMTPYGAGVEGQTMANFNMDWQNQQLQRQIAAAQAAGGLTTQAAQMQGAAPGAFLTAAGMPWTTAQGIGGQDLSTLSTMGGFGAQGANLPQMQIQDYLNYLGFGNQALSAGNQANLGLYQGQLQQAKQEGQENQAMMGGIGKALGGLWGTGLAGGGTVGGSIMGGLGSALSSLGPLAMFSDIRVKDDIDLVGELIDGTPVYSFRYMWDHPDTSRIGLMAQDVEQRRPDAVTEIAGIKAVDYGKATEFSRGLSALSAFA